MNEPSSPSSSAIHHTKSSLESLRLKQQPNRRSRALHFHFHAICNEITQSLQHLQLLITTSFFFVVPINSFIFHWSHSTVTAVSSKICENSSDARSKHRQSLKYVVHWDGAERARRASISADCQLSKMDLQRRRRINHWGVSIWAVSMLSDFVLDMLLMRWRALA